MVDPSASWSVYCNNFQKRQGCYFIQEQLFLSKQTPLSESKLRAFTTIYQSTSWHLKISLPALSKVVDEQQAALDLCHFEMKTQRLTKQRLAGET